MHPSLLTIVGGQTHFAFPAHLVTPRETTRETIDRVLANAQRERPARTLIAHEVFDASEPDAPIRDWRVRFTYSDGTERIA